MRIPAAERVGLARKRQGEEYCPRGKIQLYVKEVALVVTSSFFVKLRLEQLTHLCVNLVLPLAVNTI